MFTPYRPSDYNGLIKEFLEAQRKKSNGKVLNGSIKGANGSLQNGFAKSNGYVNGNGHLPNGNGHLTNGHV